MKKWLPLFFLTIALAFSAWGLFKAGAASVNVTALVPGICGNGVKEVNEQCDKLDLGGLACTNVGYAGGALSCKSDCTLDYSACIAPSGPTRVGGSAPPQYLPASQSQSTSGQALMRPTQLPAFVPADLNGDGKVNITDLSILLFYYGKNGVDIAKYDFDGDDTVDFKDVSILFYYWQEP